MTDDKKNLPAKSKGTAVTTTGKKSAFLEKVRAAKVSKAPATTSAVKKADLMAAAVAGVARPRLVFAFDATASREPAWDTAKTLTDAMFQAVPGQLDVALAVHGGSDVHTFTEFSSSAQTFRDRAAGIQCIAGQTRLIPIIDKALTHSGIRAIVYTGDVYEESLSEADRVADACRIRGIRVFIFHDGPPEQRPQAFQLLADRSVGAVLPFDADAPDRLRDLLSAIAVLATGGMRLLQEKRKALPGAALLLSYMGDPKNE